MPCTIIIVTLYSGHYQSSLHVIIPDLLFCAVKVDPKWKRKQMETMPTAADLAVLNVQDVNVNVQITLPSSSSSSSSSSSPTTSRGGPHISPELTVDPHIDSMKTKYSLELDIDDVFGSISNTSLGRCDEFLSHVDCAINDVYESVHDMYWDGM